MLPGSCKLRPGRPSASPGVVCTEDLCVPGGGDFCRERLGRGTGACRHASALPAADRIHGQSCRVCSDDPGHRRQGQTCKQQSLRAIHHAFCTPVSVSPCHCWHRILRLNALRRHPKGDCMCHARGRFLPCRDHCLRSHSIPSRFQLSCRCGPRPRPGGSPICLPPSSPGEDRCSVGEPAYESHAAPQSSARTAMQCPLSPRMLESFWTSMWG